MGGSSLGPLRVLARVALLGLIAAGLTSAGAAHAAEAPTITRPAADQHYSIGLQDIDPAGGFQLRAEGAAEPSKVVEVFAKRPGGQPGKVGEGNSDAQGKWSATATLTAGGEWLLNATAKDSGPAGTPGPASSDVRVFVVLRYVLPLYDGGAVSDAILVGNPGKAPARVDISIMGERRTDPPLSVQPNASVTSKYPGVVGGPIVVDSLDAVPLVVTERIAWAAGDLEEVAAVYDGSLSNDVWLPWYEGKATAGRDWLYIANLGALPTTVAATAGGTSIGKADVGVGEMGVLNAPNVSGGPVHLTATQPILASRRMLWTPTNLVETIAVSDRHLADRYVFAWFDSNSTSNASILIGNPGADPVHATILPPANAPAIDVTVAPGSTHQQKIPRTIGGPVEVRADRTIVVSQRTIWNDGASFEEVRGTLLPDVSDTYWQALYDSANASDDRLIQASSPDSDSSVNYTIAGPTISGKDTVRQGDARPASFTAKTEGPITIAGDHPFLQTKRTVWGPAHDFMEIPGLSGTRRLGPVIVLPAPASLATADLPNDDGTNLVLSWTAVGDDSVDGYWIYRSKSGVPERRVGFVPRDPIAGCPSGKLCYLDSGLTAGTDYSYRVVALSDGIVEGAGANVKGAPIDNPPAAPSGLAVAAGNRTAGLKWQSNPEGDVVSYKVYVGPDAIPSELPPNLCGEAEPLGPTYKVAGQPRTSAFLVTGLTNGTRYCFQVSAVDAAGHEGPRSAPQNATPAAPAGGGGTPGAP
jgi:hypothetical protein